MKLIVFLAMLLGISLLTVKSDGTETAECCCHGNNGEPCDGCATGEKHCCDPKNGCIFS